MTNPAVRSGLAEKSHQARDLMAAGKYEQAIPIYRELLHALPDNSGLILDLGLALHMAGREKEAIAEFDRVVKRQPGNFPAQLYLGYAFLNLGEPGKAIAPLEAALHADPSSGEARESLAKALMSVGRDDAALQEFHGLAESKPGSAAAWYGLGRCYEALSRRAFSHLEPGSAWWLALAADTRLKEQQLSSAFYLYRQALAKMPALPGAHASLAEIYRKSGHPDWAATEAAREKSLGAPDCARHNLECDYLAGRYEAVVSAALKTPEAFYWKTKAYDKLAVQAFARLASLPESRELHELLATVQASNMQYRQAADEWRKAYALSDHDAQVGTQLATALIQIEDFRGAEALLNTLLHRQPDSAELNYLYGYALLNLQQPRPAIPYLEKALAQDPKFLVADDALGRAYLQTGKSAKAIVYLKAALPIDRDGSVHYQLARAYQAAGRTQLARAMLESYQKIQRAVAAERQSTMQEVRITGP